MTEPPAATAIVVLGAAVLADGRASPALRRRVDLAARLWHERRAAVVIGSGGVGRHGPAEARVIRDGLVAAGVPAAAVREEGGSRSTFENALNSIRMMRAEGLGRAVVVTDAFHLPRALMTFRLLGMPAEGAGARPSGAPRRRWRAAEVREAAALPVCLVRVLAWRLCHAPPRP